MRTGKRYEAHNVNIIILELGQCIDISNKYTLLELYNSIKYDVILQMTRM